MKVEQVSAKICAMFIVRNYITNLQVLKIIKNMCIFLYMLRDYCCLIVFILIDNVFVQVHVQLLFHRFFMVFNSWCSGVTTFFIYQPLQTLDQSLLH